MVKIIVCIFKKVFFPGREHTKWDCLPILTAQLREFLPTWTKCMLYVSQTNKLKCKLWENKLQRVIWAAASTEDCPNFRSPCARYFCRVSKTQRWICNSAVSCLGSCTFEVKRTNARLAECEDLGCCPIILNSIFFMAILRDLSK